MLKYLCNDAITGVYGLSYNVALIVLMIFDSLNTSWVPFYYEYKKKNDTKQLKTRSNNYLFVFTIITIGFLLCIPEVFKIMAPEEYWAGLKIIPIIVLAIYIQFLYTLAVNFEFFHEKTIMISISTIITASINIGLNFWLIPLYGAVGAAIATLISYCVLLLLHDINARYRIKNYDFSWTFYLKGSVPVTIMAVLYFPLLKLWYIRWGIAIILGVLLLRRFIKTKTII